MENLEKKETSEAEIAVEVEEQTPLKNKNFNIADCFPIVKKHPYISLGVLFAIVNFGTTQESVSLVSGWLVACLFGFLAVALVVYLTKTTEDFVISPRSVLFLLPVLAAVFVTYKGFNSAENGVFKGAMFLALSLLAVFAVLKFTKRLTFQNALLLLFLAGVAVRIIYAFYTPIAENSVRQHDVWRFIAGKGDELLEEFNNRRHAEYIEYIAKYLKLPDADPSGGLSQLYHPPLHHILAGIWLRLNLTFGMTYKSAVEGIQILTAFYSSTCMITGYKIFRELGLCGKKLFRATAIVSLFPWFFLFAGGVNNDILSVALGFGAILATIKWYKNPKISKLILIAVTLGLAMFTKLSMGLLAPAIAYVFLVKFVSVCKGRENVIFTRNGQKSVGVIYMICGFALFAVVVFPLGLGWQVKNLILWDMPLTYVPSLSNTNIQYVGFHSVIERFFGVNVDTLTNPFVIWGDKGDWGFWEYNIGLGALKTGLFGEASFFALGKSADFEAVVISTIGSTFCALLYVFAIALIVISLISFYFFFKNKYYGLNKTLVRMLLVIFASFLINYVVFCFGYAFTCTMNFRYIVPCLIFPAISLATVTCREKEGSSFASRVFLLSSNLCVKGFCICGIITYVALALMPV